MVWLHIVSRSIVSNTHVNLLGYFSKILLRKLGTILLFSSTCHPQMDDKAELVKGLQLLDCVLSFKRIENLGGLFTISHIIQLSIALLVFHLLRLFIVFIY